MTVKVTFHGACGVVTGSCFEVRTDKSGILIDCGMFQGTKTIKELNYGSFPFSPQSINALMSVENLVVCIAAQSSSLAAACAMPDASAII